jgi:hypothetical protein
VSRRSLAAVLAVSLAALGLLAAPTRAGAADAVVTRTRLANGMTVLVRENPSAPVVGMSLMVRMGTPWETRSRVMKFRAWRRRRHLPSARCWA